MIFFRVFFKIFTEKFHKNKTDEICEKGSNQGTANF